MSQRAASANSLRAPGDSGRLAAAIQNHPGDPQGSPPVAHETFVQAMRGAVAGVSVVATDGRHGRFGVTVSSFAPVSADPPLVLACINRHSPACAAIAGNGCFSVSLLSTEQQHTAAVFSGQVETSQAYRFDPNDWERLPGGTPALSGAIASFECKLASSFNAGSHRVFIGQVIGADAAPGQPLLYANRKYGRPCPLNPSINLQGEST